MSGVCLGDRARLWGALLAGLLLAVVGMAQQRRMLWGLVGMGMLAWGWHGARLAKQEEGLQWAAEGHSWVMRARVVEEPRTGGAGWSAKVRDEAGRWWAWRGRGSPPREGEWIEAKGRSEGLPVSRNPGAFDGGDWWYRQGASGVFLAMEPARVVEKLAWWRERGLGLRETMRKSLVAGLDPSSREAEVIRAMVLGDHPQDDVLLEPFRNSGTLHAFSVSGLHVGLMGVIGWWLFKVLRVPRRAAVPVLLLLMGMYVWLSGMQPPAVRSWVMAAWILGAFFFRRRPDLLNALGWAMLGAVLADGHLAFQPGVQLSFGVMGAIGWGTEWIGQRAAVWTKRDEMLPAELEPWWRRAWRGAQRRLIEGFGISGVAMLGSLPLTWWHFGLVAPVSVIASTLMGPLVLALLALGLLAVTVGWIPGAAELVNRGNRVVARWTYELAAAAEKVPGGHFTVPVGRPAEEFLLIYDPGQGGSAAVWVTEDRAIGMDAGSVFAAEQILIPSMRRMGVRPTHLVLSHPDARHVGGALPYSDAFPLRQVMMPVERVKSGSYREVWRGLESREIGLVTPRCGVKYPAGEDSWLEVLRVPEPRNWHVVADERVLVCRLHWHGWRILFWQDAGWVTEEELLKAGVDPAADILVTGRNRYDGPPSDRFLQAVGPRVIVAGHADFPQGERVPEAWQAACEARGIEVWNQRDTGAVTLVPEGGGLRLSAMLGGRETVLRPFAETAAK